jgi:glutaredoxin
MNKVYIIVICLVVLVVAFMFRPKQKQSDYEPSNVPIVYGAGFCGHCTKQKKELDEAKVNYVYYDCMLPENKDKCKGITSFPTIQFPDQKEKVIGRQPLEKFKAYIKK